MSCFWSPAHMHFWKSLQNIITGWDAFINCGAPALRRPDRVKRSLSWTNNFLCLHYYNNNNNNNNPRARITIGEATQPETGHFIGVALSNPHNVQCHVLSVYYIVHLHTVAHNQLLSILDQIHMANSCTYYTTLLWYVIHHLVALLLLTPDWPPPTSWISLKCYNFATFGWQNQCYFLYFGCQSPFW